MAQDGRNKRMTAAQREEATQRVLAGESAARLAEEYGCTRAYISLLKVRALDPERFRHKAEAKLSVKLTAEQIAELKHVFDTGTPEQNGLIPARDQWSLDHGFQLAKKLFGKKPSVRAMKECMGVHLERRPDEGDPKPKPPKPHHINQLDPELAKDPEFVAYYLSPICEQIARKEYEFALAEWEKRNPHGERPVPDVDDDPQWVVPQSSTERHPPPPGQRIGKHARSKGSPFTKPKRRKRR
ncbi:MAG: hypothetical protein MUF86_04715 [Akkermansiaceae bacterium]|nr:hypothetical protein [Akkermansiaceae bacterium]MCU0776952.1 hypothetical protein [Akkermansiaceae bacterium]